MKTKEQLRDEANAALDELRRIEDREWRERNKALVGKCFKYHNSYGGDRPRWWMYAKVQRATTKYDVRGLEFQTDCDGKIDVRPNARIGPTPVDGSGWQPITAAEFNRELAKLKRKIAAVRA